MRVFWEKNPKCLGSRNIIRFLLSTPPPPPPRHLKLTNLVLFYMWEDAGVWAYWNYSFFFFGGTLCTVLDLSSPTKNRNCGSLHWNHKVLSTGPPGKSKIICLICTLSRASILFSPLSWIPSEYTVEGGCRGRWLGGRQPVFLHPEFPLGCAIRCGHGGRWLDGLNILCLLQWRWLTLFVYTTSSAQGCLQILTNTCFLLSFWW